MNTSARAIAAAAYDVAQVRADFPILQRLVHGKPLAYFDTSASAQRPRQVIDAVADFYRQHNANIHRGVHRLSVEATDAFEAARTRVATRLGAASDRQIVFTRGTTEAINLVAQSFLRPRLQPGEQILITHMEHHSNIVPWQLLCEQTGAELLVAPMDRRGVLRLDALQEMLSERVKLIAMVHVSNSLGTINPVAQVAQMAEPFGIPLLVDGAQAMPHLTVDVNDLNCDFYAFSGHKMYGPTGIGALWAKPEHLDAMPPWQGGGEMIDRVSFEGSTYAEPPGRFEAGTPNIAGAIGLAVALDYMDGLGLEQIAAYERDLLAYATDALSSIAGLRVVGTAEHKGPVISFVIDGIHPHDIGTIVDHEGFAIRTGHHCTQPVMQFFDLPATSRVSLGLYNTREEVDRFIPALERARRMLA